MHNFLCIYIYLVNVAIIFLLAFASGWCMHCVGDVVYAHTACLFMLGPEFSLGYAGLSLRNWVAIKLCIGFKGVL